MALVLLGATALPAAPGPQNQRNNNKNKKEAEMPPISSLMPLPDPQAIDLLVSQMLGAWQIGDAEMMKQYYADDVLVVSGAWEPPIHGWKNYLLAYQAQRARTLGTRLDRRNTFIQVQGETGWCTYQWQFSGQVDGSPTSAAGHTTLVLQKRAGAWLIVLNHTSVAPTPPRPAPTPAAPAGPQSQHQQPAASPGG
jgi:ketosteroid isomerase-like protein